ncbi:hypothetical protein TNCV_3177821 [Trichonephila clavipes]|nr:hypothetical protein TNCV_3177821 [Trichonephila clavipes]
MFVGLDAFAVVRGRYDSGARRAWFRSRPGSSLKEGRFVLGTFRSERMRVLNRSRQNDLRVMLVLVDIDITPPHIHRIITTRNKINGYEGCPDP